MVLATTSMAKEMDNFFVNHPLADWTDLASEFGFAWDSEAEEYYCKNHIILSSLCPHDITIITDNGTINVPSVGVARCESQTTTEYIGDLPIQHIRYGKITGLPEIKEGWYYIVSKPVFEAAQNSERGSADLFTVGETVRNGSEILGCKGLVK